MRVLNVNVLLDPVYGGGTAERTYQMSKALARSGAECTILTTDVGLTEQRVKSLLDIRVVALPCIFKRFFIVGFSWREIKKMVSDSDVIHLMGHWNMLNVVVYFFAKRTGKPYVICPAGELSLFGRSIWMKRLFNFVIGNRIVCDAAGYVAVTVDEIPTFESYGVSSELVTVIPNGINEIDLLPENNLKFSEQLGLEKAPFILFMGRLNPIKGPDLLLEAFCLIERRFPSLHLVFAGPDGGLQGSLLQTVKDNELSNKVHFVGYIEGGMKANAYSEAKCLIIPSRKEAMSIVVLEAGLLGTPVLLTDQCGFDEVANVGGGMVVPATVNGLEKGLTALFDRMNELEVMGGNLKKFVKHNYTWELISVHYMRLYKKLLG